MNKLILALGGLLLFACSSDKVIEKRHSFDDLKWNRFQPVSFDFEIKDITSTYDLSVLLRHHSIFPYNDLLMTVALYTPSGERRLRDIDLWVRNQDGSFKSSGMGDLWDIEQTLFSAYTFNETGKYKIEFENRMPKYDTEGVIELGLKIRKSK